MSPARLLALPLVLLMVGACNNASPMAQASPSAAPSPRDWSGRGTLAVYEGRSGSANTIWVVGFDHAGTSNAKAKVLARVTAAARTPRPALACPPSISPLSGCNAPFDLPSISTSKSRVYILDGDTDVRSLAPDGSTAPVTSVKGSATADAAFAVSPDDTRIAVAVFNSGSGTFTFYVENLRGGGRVDVFSGAAPYYWPIRWRNGKVLLAMGGSGLNPYGASGYALVDPVAGAKPVALTKGDCSPTGTLTAAGTACIVRPGTQCLEGLVTSAVSPSYYNSCLRRVGWDGTETTFLVPKTAYTSTFTVDYAALSPGGDQITTDQLGKLEAPVSATHGGNSFLGPGTGTIRTPGRPCMGWIDASIFSFTYVNPDGSTDVRLLGATFAGSTDIAPGVPSSPVNGDLVGTVPDEFDR